MEENKTRVSARVLLVAAILIVGGLFMSLGAPGFEGGCGSFEGEPGKLGTQEGPLDGYVVFEDDVMIPVGVGAVELAAFVRRPVDVDENPILAPTIFLFTPYDKDNTWLLWFEETDSEPLFDSNNYAFVVADWRGYHGSGGQPGGYLQRGLDAKYIIDWIASQPWSDGKVGMWGVSALGGVQISAAQWKPDALKAIVPIFANPGLIYEQYLPGGVPRKEYLTSLGYLEFGNGEDFIRIHPTYDDDWIAYEKLLKPEVIEVPVLTVSGFFDLCNGCTLDVHERLVNSPEKHLLMGEWHHFAVGGETDYENDQMTEQELLWWDKKRRIQRESLAFFDQHLRGVESRATDWPPVRYQRGKEWLSADTWPPAGASELTFYLGDGTLTTEAPGEVDLEFDYHPRRPYVFEWSLSPTIGGQTLHIDELRGPHHQDEVLIRNDKLLFVSDPLSVPLKLAGPISCALQASTTGEDTHFAIRLTDFDPETGKHLLLTDGIRRMSLYESLSQQNVITPGDFYTVPVEGTNHLGWLFEEGHSIGLIVTSSNNPRFEPSPNSWDHIFFNDIARFPAPDVTNTVRTGLSTLTLTVAAP